MREVHLPNPRMVMLRRRAMATDRPLITCRRMADILRRDTATGRRRPMGSITPRRTKVVWGSTSSATDAEEREDPPAFHRRMDTIMALRLLACRVKMEKPTAMRRLVKRVPGTARVPKAVTVERAVDLRRRIVRAMRPVVGSRMAVVAAVARRPRRLPAIIPRITAVRHRDIPAEGGPTVGRRRTATRPMAIRLIIRMLGTVRPLLVTVADHRMMDMTDVVVVVVVVFLGLTTLVAVLAMVLVLIQSSASQSAVVQRVVMSTIKARMVAVAILTMVVVILVEDRLRGP